MSGPSWTSGQRRDPTVSRSAAPVVAARARDARSTTAALRGGSPAKVHVPVAGHPAILADLARRRPVAGANPAPPLESGRGARDEGRRVSRVRWTREGPCRGGAHAGRRPRGGADPGAGLRAEPPRPLGPRR